jgi:hypothetical protein
MAATQYVRGYTTYKKTGMTTQFSTDFFGGYPSAYHVYVPNDGVIVAHFHQTPDPLVLSGVVTHTQPSYRGMSPEKDMQWNA